MTPVIILSQSEPLQRRPQDLMGREPLTITVGPVEGDLPHLARCEDNEDEDEDEGRDPEAPPPDRVRFHGGPAGAAGPSGATVPTFGEAPPKLCGMRHASVSVPLLSAEKSRNKKICFVWEENFRQDTVELVHLTSTCDVVTKMCRCGYPLTPIKVKC